MIAASVRSRMSRRRDAQRGRAVLRPGDEAHRCDRALAEPGARFGRPARFTADGRRASAWLCRRRGAEGRPHSVRATRPIAAGADVAVDDLAGRRPERLDERVANRCRTSTRSWARGRCGLIAAGEIMTAPIVRVRRPRSERRRGSSDPRDVGRRRSDRHGDGAATAASVGDVIRVVNTAVAGTRCAARITRQGIGRGESMDRRCDGRARYRCSRSWRCATRAQSADAARRSRAGGGRRQLRRALRALPRRRADADARPERDIGWMNGLSSDFRARRLNDLVTIKVVESITASGTADSSLDKRSNGSASVTELFGARAKAASDGSIRRRSSAPRRTRVQRQRRPRARRRADRAR